MKSVGIIGAGITGLVLAYRFAKSGYKVTILEKGNEIGGLAGGFEIQGNHLEKAYHHIFKSDVDIIDLVKELGIEDKLNWYESSTSIYSNGKVYPFKTPIDLIKFSPIPLIDRLRAGVVVFFLQKYNNWKSLENISAYDWMYKWAGKNVVKVIWGPLLKGKFDKYYKDVSMAWLWARIHVRANSRSTDSSNSKELLGYFDGGFNTLITKLEKQLLELHVNIIKNVTIENIISDNKYAIVKTSNQKLKFDKVIAAIPSNVFAKLVNKSVDKKYIKQLESISYIGAVLVVFASDQDISDFYWHNINDENIPFLVFINHTKLVGKEKYNNKNLYYIGTYLPHEHKFFSMKDEDLYDLWFTNLKKVFPNFDETKVIEKHIFKFKNAQHIVNIGYKDKIPSYETPLKNVYLANFSQIYPEDRGTNYAVKEADKLFKLIVENDK